MGANVVCLQEAWTSPFFFCTRERYPWSEFAEDAENGRSTLFIKQVLRFIYVAYYWLINKMIFKRWPRNII